MGKFSQNLRQAGILKEWNDQFPFRIWSCWRSEANRWSGVRLWIWMTGGLAICSNEKKEDIQIKIMYNLRHFYSTERKNGGGARSSGVSAQFPSPENRNPERFWYRLEEEKILNKPVMEIECFWPNTADKMPPFKPTQPPFFKTSPRIEIIHFPQNVWFSRTLQEILYKTGITLFIPTLFQ